MIDFYPFILQVQQEIITRPDIAYDLAKQLGTIASVVGLLWLLLKGKQKAIDDKAELLAADLKSFKTQVVHDTDRLEGLIKEQTTKLENDLREELKQFYLDYKETEERVREIEKNYIARFEEVKEKIGELALEVRQVLTEFKNLKKD